MSEEQYTDILDGLLVDMDMDDEVSRKMAYNASLAYAEENLSGSFEVNTFAALASARLGQLRVHYGVIKSMVPLPDEARLHLKYAPTGGSVLTGNTMGLQYLSDLCAALAGSPLPEGSGPEEHVHLYAGEPPMFGYSYGLTVYHSADTWFDNHTGTPEEDAADDEASASPPPREIAPKQIAAIEFFEDDKIPFPPTLYLCCDKLYRVLNQREYLPGEDTPSKTTGGEGRMCVFTFRDDAQEIFEIALDLDDAGIHYFTKDDLEQVWRVDP